MNQVRIIFVSYFMMMQTMTRSVKVEGGVLYLRDVPDQPFVPQLLVPVPVEKKEKIKLIDKNHGPIVLLLIQ